MKNYKLRIKELLPNNISQNYLNWMNNNKILKYTNSGKSKITLDELRKYVLYKKKSYREFLFGIYFKNSHVGNIKLGPIDFKKKIAPIGYIIGVKKFQNKGFATKAINKILNYGFKKKKLKKIRANSHEKNLASIKTLKKNGFRKTGYRFVKRKFGKEKLIYFSVSNKNRNNNRRMEV
jgi:ribosomal-protein-alanine N-acetyltransferase